MHRTEKGRELKSLGSVLEILGSILQISNMLYVGCCIEVHWFVCMCMCVYV